MRTHEFTLVLEAEDITDDQCSLLYEAGCDDGTISTSGRLTRIDFCRQGPTLEDAVRSAIAHVNSAGLQVSRVEIEAGAFVAS